VVRTVTPEANRPSTDRKESGSIKEIESASNWDQTPISG
jgi:hypothetical protein